VLFRSLKLSQAIIGCLSTLVATHIDVIYLQAMFLNTVQSRF